MNNVIKVGVLLGSSMLPGVSLISPAIDFYSGNRMQENWRLAEETALMRISRAQTEGLPLNLGCFASSENGIRVLSVLSSAPDDYSVLESVVRRIQQGVSISPDFSRGIDEDFWDLI